MSRIKIQIWILIFLVSTILISNTLYNQSIIAKNISSQLKKDLINQVLKKLDELHYLMSDIDDEQKDYIIARSENNKADILQLRQNKSETIKQINTLLSNSYFNKIDIKDPLKQLNKFENDFNKFSSFGINLTYWILADNHELSITSNSCKIIENKLYQYRLNINSQQEKDIDSIFIVDIIQTLLIIIITGLMVRILWIHYKKLKQFAIELQDKNKSLNELNGTKDKFVSIISHDLKSPFNSIIGLSKLLMQNGQNYNPEKILNFALQIYQAAKRTYDLLDNLLDWSRLQTGKIKPEFAHVQLAAIVNDITQLLEASAIYKSIQLNVNVPGDLMIFCDKNMINTVLRNLLNNAIKFTDTDGKIAINASINEYIEISISDNGVGISKDIIAQLFAIEAKNSTQGTNGESGTGLGLLLCKELIDMHHGKIEVASQTGVGTTFTVHLPVIL